MTVDPSNEIGLGGRTARGLSVRVYAWVPSVQNHPCLFRSNVPRGVKSAFGGFRLTRSLALGFAS